MLRRHQGLLSLSARCASSHCRIRLPLSTPPTSSVFAQARPPQRVQTPILGPTPLKRVIVSQVKSSVDSMQIRSLDSRGRYPAALRLVHTPAHGGQGRPKARGRGSGTSSKHIQLNQDLITAAKSGDGEQLYVLVMERLKDFNAVNAATAYQKLLLMRIARDSRRQQTLIGPKPPAQPPPAQPPICRPNTFTAAWPRVVSSSSLRPQGARFPGSVYARVVVAWCGVRTVCSWLS